MNHRRSRARSFAGVLVAAGAVLLLVACGGSDAASASSSTSQDPTTSQTSEVPMDPRAQLIARFGDELGDADAAARTVAGMDDAAVAGAERLADGDIATSPWLSYRPTTAPAGDIDSLWVFSYGFRLADPSREAVPVGGSVPPMDALVPGPTNEALARAARDFVAEHPMPIVAQWEVARVLHDLGVDDVISVEPDVSADGTVTYLSTVGVAEKGLAALRARGGEPGHAGVLCFRDHAVRCGLTMRSLGLSADVPSEVELPAEYDPESGQLWTRKIETWIPIDLAGRAVLKG